MTGHGQSSSYVASSPGSHYRGDQPVQMNPQGQPYVQRKGPLRLKGYLHIFDPYSVFKLQSPRFYRKPGYGYEKLATHRHLDCFEREWVGDYDDRYISAYDGKISKLVVQSVDDIYDGAPNSTWRRTFIRNIAPFYLRLANWPLNHVDYDRNGGPTSEDWPMICVKWFFASIAITFVVCCSLVGTPTKAEGQVRHEGRYDPVPYKYYGYPKVARNALEMDTPRGYGSEPNPVAERVLRPRYLCFLRDEGSPAMIMNVEEWITQYKAEKNLSYVFVAYTAEQFRTTEDLRALHQMADAAARNAGVPAYWIGCSCMPEPDNLQEDVYRICDVIRGAHSVAIAVARPPNDTQGINTTDLMLQQWGKRIWTFPEVLLAPAGKDIKVYTRGMDLFNPTEVAKNQFAIKVWKGDAHVARQLVDHYEGNLILNQLELVTLALECLHNRDTTQYLLGDHSYALMGLLRIRPRIDPTDSAFQAFARLSLANDSEQLLERLICVMPKSPHQPWHSMDDAYNAKLWDILPQECTIAGVGNDDTIILDGCRAANIRWKSFAPVAYKKIPSWKRLAAQRLIHLGGFTMLIAMVLLSIPKEQGGAVTVPAGAFLLVYSIILMGLSPWLLRVMYLGKFWGTQGWFFGFEGYMDIDTIERQIFGGRLGRLKWTPYGSPLSRHHKNAHGDCIADDPCSDPKTKAFVEQVKNARPGEQRVFTLVDTGTMTVTLFVAERPPVCFLLAGSEGGMQRGIGCSYDWTTQTMYRETVLRFETPIVDQIFRVPRVKVGFKRPLYPIRGLAEIGEAKGHLSH
ncbi:uncharacterized protein BDR25DRAFT_223590 [Lindgomyces ingoldianus]|uniref:Uncharacterized protein n=1 Tax=Lindgomyces ingoldianus TaxID=673940 RepID=A0ACB6QVT4_9PLEO|nr:uncharacterized protein BDR25DRAFT_223590 [Lindgomyces ingoldianus]KAF2471129.1 hypothetical protein BDR25DRAFT_223590 [Lindgomyces ingoldianus]